MFIILKKVKSLISKTLDITSGLLFLPKYFNGKGFIYISYAIPRFTKGRYNWGDDLNVALVEILTEKQVIPYKFRLFSGKNYLVVGSVIQWYSNRKSLIWGAGLLHEMNFLPQKPLSVLAVRGPLTRASLLKCGVECPEIYGDPALLLPILYKPTIIKKFKVGLIFHFTEILGKVDINLPDGLLVNEVLVIDIMNYDKWTDFIDKILSCEVILSSSLHGLIVADAYKVPNCWTIFSEYSKKESTFKYRDYYLSVNKKIDEPFFYESLIKEKDLVKYLKEKWTQPDIDLNLLIESCPFNQELLKINFNVDKN